MGDKTRTRIVSRCCLAVLAVTAGVLSACARGTTEVSPDEIPALEQRLARDPDNASVLLRYAAALFAANQCDSASAVAYRATQSQPKDAVGPLVIGQCRENASDYDGAIATYAAYLATYPNERGSASVRARELFARQAKATADARAALEAEARLQEGDPETVAVLPLEIVGDSSYAALSRGLAQILTSDLTLLQRFRMVERLQIGALMSELDLTETQRVDQNTAARVGRLLRAGRLVQGVAALPDEGDARLDASIVFATGEVRTAAPTTGRVRDLMQMQKELVINIATQLGYRLSAAERNLILENGTQNLVAFLAFSNALIAEDRGDYVAAAGFYAEAVQSDPDFQQARDGYQANTVAPDVQQAAPGAVTTTAMEQPTEPEALTAASATTVSLGTTVLDLAPNASEITAPADVTSTTGTGTTGKAGTTSNAEPPPTIVNNPPSQSMGTIRIRFRLP